MEPNAYYWRDSNGLEVDLVTEENQQLKLYEIKSSATMNEKFFSSINKLCILSKTPPKNTNVVYGGNTTLNASDTHSGYISWMDL